MAKSRVKKQTELRTLVERAGQAKSVVFANFNGLGVQASESLRNALREEQAEMLVAKKTLIDLAFKDKGLEGFSARKMDGQLAAVFGFGDEVVPAKLVAKYKKENEGKLDFAGGILEGRFISAAEVTELAKLPSKQELLGQLVGTLNAPVSGFVNALAGNLRNLVYVLKAIEEQKA